VVGPRRSADEADNVESVFLPAGVAGAFTVTVAATSINSIGVPNGSNGLTQDFALVVDNAVGTGPPVIVPAGAVLAAENCLPTNGVIDPGETVTVNFTLQNIGTVNTTNLIATLQAGGGIDLPGGPAVYGALPAGGAPVSQPLAFTAGGVCGGTITATLQLQDGPASLGSVSFTFPLGQFVPVVPLTQNFDGVTPPALPANWTTSVEGGQVAWITTNGVADTPPNSAFAQAVTNAGIADLFSPVIPIATSSAQLVFRNNYDLEVNPYAPTEALDGGVLEIQIGTNAFTDILAAGGSFVTNGYDCTIAPSQRRRQSIAQPPMLERQFRRICHDDGQSSRRGGRAEHPVEVALRHRHRQRLRLGGLVDRHHLDHRRRELHLLRRPVGAAASPARKFNGTNFTFSFQTASNQTYVVEYNNTLSGGAWTPVQTFTGDGTIQFITNGLNSSQGYYRLRGSATATPRRATWA
jgi:hypothetical protein